MFLRIFTTLGHIYEEKRLNLERFWKVQNYEQIYQKQKTN